MSPLFPDTHQLKFGNKGGSYLHSLWLGTVWPMLNLPRLLWLRLVLPILYIVLTLVLGVIFETANRTWMILFFNACVFFEGVRGKLSVQNITMEEFVAQHMRLMNRGMVEDEVPADLEERVRRDVCKQREGK
jgi:hypothetical protein